MKFFPPHACINKKKILLELSKIDMSQELWAHSVYLEEGKQHMMKGELI